MKKSAANPFTKYTVLAGNQNTFAPFIPLSRGQQRLSGNNGIINLECYHTKIDTGDGSVILSMGNGFQNGQLKKLFYAFSGNSHPDNTVTVQCPNLNGLDSSIVLSQVGDTVLLFWDGGRWHVLESYNKYVPSTDSPLIQ